MNQQRSLLPLCGKVVRLLDCRGGSYSCIRGVHGSDYRLQ